MAWMVEVCCTNLPRVQCLLPSSFSFADLAVTLNPPSNLWATPPLLLYLWPILSPFHHSIIDEHFTAPASSWSEPLACSPQICTVLQPMTTLHSFLNSYLFPVKAIILQWEHLWVLIQKWCYINTSTVKGLKGLNLSIFSQNFYFFMLKIQILCVKSVKTVVHNLTVTLFKWNQSIHDMLYHFNIIASSNVHQYLINIC